MSCEFIIAEEVVKCTLCPRGCEVDRERPWKTPVVVNCPKDMEDVMATLAGDQSIKIDPDPKARSADLMGPTADNARRHSARHIHH